MDYCWKCGGPMSKNSRERVCKRCGRTVQRHNGKIANDICDSSDGSIGESIGDILGTYMAIIDADKREQARIKSEKRRVWKEKYRREIFLTLIVLIIAILLFIGYHEMKLLIPIGYNNEYLEGHKYTEVVQLLKESGFTNIRVKELSDLTLSRQDEENMVTEVKLLHTDEFKEYTKYPANLQITIVYHTIELYTPPLTAKDAKGMNYEDVIKKFENVGFTNISINVEYDIITGWITDDGEVKSITINGNSKYDYYDKYRLDAEIVITYHTLKSNKPN